MRVSLLKETGRSHPPPGPSSSSHELRHSFTPDISVATYERCSEASRYGYPERACSTTASLHSVFLELCCSRHCSKLVESPGIKAVWQLRTDVSRWLSTGLFSGESEVLFSPKISACASIHLLQLFLEKLHIVICLCIQLINIAAAC